MGEPDYFAKFEIERTQGALQDAGRSLAFATGQVVALFAVSCLLIFGVKSDDSFVIQSFNLELKKWSAVYVLVGLLSAATFRVKGLEVSQKILRRKLRIVLDKEGSDMSAWNVEYPSLHMYRLQLRYINSRRANLLGLFLYRSLWSLLFVGPPLLMLAVALKGPMSWGFTISVVFSALCLLVTAISHSLGPKGLDGELIDGLDRIWREKW